MPYFLYIYPYFFLIYRMKFITLHICDSKIELHNSVLGKETIIVDGQIISEKYSLTGANHRFSIRDNGQDKPAQLNTKLTMNGAIFDLYVDNKPVVEIPDNINSLSIFWLLLFISLVLLFIFSN